MPFIRGRYHINPIAGEALEAAREAEAALLALQQAAQSHADADDAASGDGASPSGARSSRSAGAPVHHVEIEVAQLVPAAAGRAARGFVARVHRLISPDTGAQPGARQGAHSAADFPADPARDPDDQADGFAAPSAPARNPSAGSRSASLRRPGLEFHVDAGASSSATPANARDLAARVNAAPETHVFTSHADLVNFLRDLFSQDCES